MILHYLVGHSFSHIRERIKEDGVFHGIIGLRMVSAGVFFVVYGFLFFSFIVFGLSSPFSGVLGVFRLSVVCCRSGFLFASPCGGSAGSSPCGCHRFFFGRFLSTFGRFSSTFGGFLSTYSSIFSCIFQIFFVTL